MEALIYFAVFILLAAVCVLATGMDKRFAAARELSGEIRSKRKSLQTPKSSLLRKLIALHRRRKANTAQVQMPESSYNLLTVSCIALGAVSGKLVFGSTVFVVLIGALGAFLPLVFLSFRLTKTRSSRMEKLRSTMMILSGSYIVTEDFISSVQDNLELLEYPQPFRDFLTYCNYIGNIKVALRRLDSHVNNVYFSQWIDALIMAQDDRSLKYVTMSVVDSMNDIAQAQMESDTATYSVWREYFIVLVLIFAAPLIFKILMPAAYTILVSSFIGQALLILLLAAVVFSVWRALKLNKPILM